MHPRTWSMPAFALLALLLPLQAALASTTRAPQDSAPQDRAPQDRAPQERALRALDGEWTYLEDRTDGRALEQLGPPMSNVFALRTAADAVILVHGHGSGHRDVRVALDGSVTEVAGKGNTARYRGRWQDGVFAYEVDFLRAAGQEPQGLIRRSFRSTPDGLIVEAWNHPSVTQPSVGLYRHAEDIPLPTPAKATIGDLAWLAGNWVGTRGEGGATAIEERWSPPRGGAMLAVSRTVARERMRAFEFLRIVERDGGLVYVAQPGGAAPTEFVLTELAARRAVFDNPRHDYPKRIVYELGDDGVLRATIGFTKGGTPRRFEFAAEAR